MATRKTFAGDDSIADHLPQAPTKRYGCAANGCPMPGTISGGGHGSSSCSWHYGTSGHDWPRITQVLLDWQCVSDEINTCRRAHTDPETCGNPKVLDDMFDAAWRRMGPLVGAWEKDLRPQAGRGGQMDSYVAWSLRLERFIGGRVVDVIRHQLGRKAA